MQVPVVPTAQVEQAARKVNGLLIRFGHVIPIFALLICVSISAVVTIERQLVYTPFVWQNLTQTAAPVTTLPPETTTLPPPTTTTSPSTTAPSPTPLTTTPSPTTTPGPSETSVPSPNGS